MRPGDRDDRDPFEDIFSEIERMMNGMMGGDMNVHTDSGVDVTDAHVAVYEDEEDETVRVVADLPGIEKSAIDLKCDGKYLTLNAVGDRREFTERVRLPVRVDERTANATYNNGILEVVFDRADVSADINLE